ncbi:unnamed protein product [Oncorhynchus mykiss]|uniref:Uncharacterized protein n=1 Tax=Oncorhynchus mykiss TaxID=8022 RepID=A0A060WFA4_ONCMY|nr:unnamed protein product [Oncorhynchus mykiss]
MLKCCWFRSSNQQTAMMSSSSETCPFCGKNFKRLNSHLPRCKMAPVTTTTQRSQTPPGPADLITYKNSKKTSLPTSSSSPSTTSTKSKKASSSSPSPALSPLATTTKSKKSSSLTTTKNNKKTPSPSSSSSSSSSSSTTTSKKRQKLLDETLSKDSKLSLGEVRLKELPCWIATRAPRNPRNGVQALISGWQWYYRRYIDVRKGGVGGVAMLLAGYCVLGYTWHYPHIKHDRWRKYH